MQVVVRKIALGVDEVFHDGGPMLATPIRKGWVGITRPWHLLTEDTGVGDPAAATAGKGHELMGIVVERLGDFLYELAVSPMDEKFPFEP